MGMKELKDATRSMERDGASLLLFHLTSHASLVEFVCNVFEVLDLWFVDNAKCCIYKMITTVQENGVLKKGKPHGKTKSDYLISYCTSTCNSDGSIP
jgi:hypothetical protein